MMAALFRRGRLKATVLAAAAMVAGVMGVVGGSEASAQCSRNWTAAPNGVNGPVKVMQNWDPDGGSPAQPVLVVGGDFTVAGDISANRVAYWDGFLWRSLGDGFNGPVRALAVYNGELYAGGDFTATGGTPVQYFAKWTGTQWVTVSFGTDGPVGSLFVRGTELLVGGSFQNVGGGIYPFRYLARYSPGSWSSFPEQPSGPVSGIGAANGQPVISVYRWDAQFGAQYIIHRWDGSEWDMIGDSWSPAIGTLGSAVYFSSHGPSCNNMLEIAIVRYDGVSTPEVSLLERDVESFTVHNGLLYALGRRRARCLLEPDYEPWMGVFNGTSWSSFASTPESGDAVGVLNGEVYVGGRFDRAAYTVQASNIARWTGIAWTPLASTFNSPARCAMSFGGTPWVGGDFTASGNIALGRIAYFNGSIWVPAGSFGGPVTSMMFFSTDSLAVQTPLVASGQFTTVGPFAASYLASRDPQTGVWSQYAGGLNGPALAMMSVSAPQLRRHLVLGGSFTTAGGVTVNRIARWTGSAWATYGTGMNGDVRALAFYGGVVAGGLFTTANGVPVGYLAVWNGTTWASIGGGTNGPVRALAVLNGKLYVGGEFTTVGGQPIPYLAVWNGSSWESVGGAPNAAVNTLAVSGSSLVAGGSFTQIGTSNFNRIATWTGTGWSPVGYLQDSNDNGVNGVVSSIAISGGDLVAAGSFSHATGQFSPFVARAVSPDIPVIFEQPVSASTCPSQDATFNFGVRTGGWFVNADFQWYHNGNAIVPGMAPNGTEYSVDDQGRLYVERATPGAAGNYWCVATTGCGEVLSSQTVTLTVGGPLCPAACGTADFDQDGDSGTDADIEAFFACLGGACCPACATADFDADGDTGTDADIEAFFRVLGGGNC